MKLLQNKINTNGKIYQICLILISLISFLTVFILPRNKFIKTISVIVRYNNSRFLIILVILLLLSFLIKNIRLSNIGVAVIIFPIFAFALVGLWSSMYTETNVITGILPRKDALSFFTSAMSLIERGNLAGYSTTRRPLFGAFMASLLWIFKENMLVSLTAIAFISAVVSYFALIEVRKTLNTAAAIIFFIPQFLYYRRYIGNVMSETLGYILGMIAISFFIMAYRRRKVNSPFDDIMFQAGIFFFTLSQLTRPGALMTLPLLVICVGWLFKKANQKYWKVMIQTSLMIAFAFLLFSFLSKQLNLPGGPQYSNAFNGIYGVIKGGKDWGQLPKDYPGLYSLPNGKREFETFQIVISEFFSNPNNFIIGMRSQFSYIFSLEPIYNYNIYSYMLSNNLLVDKILIYSYFIFSIIGIANAVYKHTNPLYRFTIVLLLGFFLSLPISPASHSQFMRYYPATIPLLGLLPAIGITIIVDPLFKKINLSRYFQPNNGEELFQIQNGFSIILVLLIIIIPLLLTKYSSKLEINSKGCQVGDSEVIMSYFPNSEIIVKEIVKTWLPNISKGDFKLRINDIPDTASINLFESIPIPTVIFPSLNLITNQRLYVVLENFQVPDKKTTFRACGPLYNIGESDKGDGIFYANMIEEME